MQKPFAKPNPPPVEIRIEDLYKAFGDHQVLKGIDLDIDRGDVLAIVGGSGCGKTVLLNHILGLLVPDRGRVLVADHDAEGAPLRNLARISQPDRDRIHTQWGMVFQRNALFSGTVFDNIALWLREVKNMPDERIRPIARRALKSVGLSGEEAFLNLNQESLSGGMAKRLAVARAVATDPVVVFYDEPTTGLDPTSSAQIHDLIYDMHVSGAALGRTTVIITHDKDLLSRLRPRTVMLHEGGVYFDGPFEEFETRSGDRIIRPYFELMPVLHNRNPELPPPVTA